MAMQEFSELFNMKIDKYEAQGMPLEQAAEAAKQEMREDPRVQKLIQSEKQNINRQQVGNPQQQQMSGAAPGVTGFAGQTIANMVTQATPGGGISEETKTGAEEAMRGLFGYVGQNPEIVRGLNIKSGGGGGGGTPYIQQRMMLEQLKEGRKKPKYDPQYAGKAYAPPQYGAINVMRALQNLEDKQNVEAEQKEILKQQAEKEGYDQIDLDLGPTQRYNNARAHLRDRDDELYQDFVSNIDNLRSKVDKIGTINEIAGVIETQKNLSELISAGQGYLEKALTMGSYGDAAALTDYIILATKDVLTLQEEIERRASNENTEISQEQKEYVNSLSVAAEETAMQALKRVNGEEYKKQYEALPEESRNLTESEYMNRAAYRDVQTILQKSPATQSENVSGAGSAIGQFEQYRRSTTGPIPPAEIDNAVDDMVTQFGIPAVKAAISKIPGINTRSIYSEAFNRVVEI